MASRARVVYPLLALLPLLGGQGCGCEAEDVKASPLREGERCERDEQCETALCADIPGEPKVCRRTCEAGCLASEVCTSFSAGSEGRIRAGCVPERAGLCRACEEDSDCPYLADLCLEVEGDRFCGRDCSYDGKCPDGYVCGDGMSSSGAPAPKQCIPKTLTCACLPQNKGQERPCEVKNTYGVCKGTETCDGSTGFTGCTAKIPSAERCNKLDDDCDGQVDEEIPNRTCGEGDCKTTVAGCDNGVEVECVPKQARQEVCDGRDNNCDGKVDELFDFGSVETCGGCDNVCTVDNGIPKCDGVNCKIAECNAGFQDCDAKYVTGCEIDLLNDPRHCGKCGNACSAYKGTASCVKGECKITSCEVGFGDCDGEYGTGCETNLNTSLVHCGACNSLCLNLNSTAVCDAGQCKLACNLGYGDCDAKAATGCEADLLNDAKNCNGCGQTCSVLNGVPGCSAGKCTVASCAEPFLHCDSDVVNGCETNKLTDVDRCGSCNNKCTDRPNSTKSCQGGTCKYACTGDFQACNNGGDASDTDGCESNKKTDVSHCGNCQTACSAGANSTATCSNSNCGMTCKAGYANCDGSLTTGCERRIDTLGAPPTCSGVNDMGEIFGDAGSATLTASGTTEGVYKFRLKESDDNWNWNYLSAAVKLQAPPGVLYNVYVSTGACGTNQTNYPMDVAGGVLNLGVCTPEALGSTQTFDVYVEIAYGAGTGCAPWTLTITGNVVVQACE